MNKHIRENCLVHPCPLEGVVSLTCHSAHPASSHVDNDLDDIFFKTAKSTKPGGKICWLMESRSRLRNTLTGKKYNHQHSTNL